MGNCLFQGSSYNDMQWGGEDWSCLQSPRKVNDNKTAKRKQKREFKRQGISASTEKKVTSSQVVPETVVAPAPTSTSKRIKVKISKKQLGKLVEEINSAQDEGKKLLIQQVLDKLFTMSTKVDNDEIRNGVVSSSSWKPRLQSIPELT